MGIAADGFNPVTVCHAIATQKHVPTIELPRILVMVNVTNERHAMTDATLDKAVCYIHQIFPRPFHELVAKLRQETARADVLGDTGNPVTVIGVEFTLDRVCTRYSARLGVRFLVERQAEPLWTASQLHGCIKGTPAEALLATMLRHFADGTLPVADWTPPAELSLGDAPRLRLAALASLTVLGRDATATGATVDRAGSDTVKDRPRPWTLCLQEARNDIEVLELPLRAASDFRRFQALRPDLAATAAEPDFSGLAPIPALAIGAAPCGAFA